MPAPAPWETFPHDADVGVRGRGATRAEAFANAAMAMTSIITEPSNVERHDSVEISCECPDEELLLVEFLNSVIFQMAVRHLLFSKFLVTIDGNKLHAILVGEPVSVKRHQPAVEVKGATLTELAVEKGADGWMAQCVVDV